MKKISKFLKYRITKAIPEFYLKKGAVFEWSEEDGCFVTCAVPWHISPLVTRSQMRRKIFEVVK